MDCAVVILNWNGKKFLQDFLPGVIEHSKQDAEIIIADNASTDDSIPFLQQHFPGARLVLLDSNYGFAEGYNRALQQVQAGHAPAQGDGGDQFQQLHRSDVQAAMPDRHRDRFAGEQIVPTRLRVVRREGGRGALSRLSPDHRRSLPADLARSRRHSLCHLA